HDAAERAVTHRHLDRLAGVGHFLAADQTFGGVHRDGAHGRFTEMLRDLEHEAIAAVLGLERVENGRQVAFELHVDDGAHDLGDATDLVGCCSHLTVSFDPNFLSGQTAYAPEIISMSSLVIWA